MINSFAVELFEVYDTDAWTCIIYLGCLIYLLKLWIKLFPYFTEVLHMKILIIKTLN